MLRRTSGLGGRDADPIRKDGQRHDPPERSANQCDSIKGKCCLFFIFTVLVWLNVLFFTFVPIFRAGQERDLQRVRATCPHFEYYLLPS